MSEELLELHQHKKGGFTPRELFLKYARFIPWVVLFMILMVILGWLRLRYTVPIYNVSAKLLVKSTSSNSGGGEKFDDIFMMQSSRNNMADEIEIIKSRLMAKRVIASLNFQYQYINKGQLRSTAIHQNEMPFIAETASSDSLHNAGIAIKVLSDNEFTIGDPPVKYTFGAWFDMGGRKWRLRRTNRSFSDFASKEFVVSWGTLENMSAGLSNALKIVRMDNYTNILTLSYETENTTIGRDILNQYMTEYQEYSLEDKQQIAFNTLEFIDEQLDTVRNELGGVERNLKDFRVENKVIDPDGQSRFYLENMNEYSRIVLEQSVKIKVADQLINYIEDEKNPYRIVPTTLGILEPSLVQQISEYNKLTMERATSLNTMPAANPIIINLEGAINKLKGDILENLKNIRKTYSTMAADYEKNNQFSESQVKTLPGIQKRLLEISRQQKILEELYSYLLQKRLETSIGSASTISNIRVVEPAYSSNNPIRPDRKSVYLMVIFIGLLIPVGIIFLMDYLNDRVQTKRDVQKVTDSPILGEIGHSDDNQALVVGKTNRKVVAEQFRMIRTNLQYILHEKKKMVIMVTSSFSGEGKSFVSTNIAGVIALTGKRVVILEFDIRKPKILHGLGLKRSSGITNFIVGSAELHNLPVPVTTMDNLFVIPCGPVPPNPAELLLDPKIEEVFEYAKKEFDVVIVDTAPVGLVSDAITLGKFADATVYIVRHNYTQKRQIQLVEDLYTAQKLPAMSVVINDIKIKLGYGGYYGYGGYGYGYGYGYGKRSSAYAKAASYYGEEAKSTFTFWEWLRRKFR